MVSPLLAERFFPEYCAPRCFSSFPIYHDSPPTVLPRPPAPMHIRPVEGVPTLSYLFAASAAGMLWEVFWIGTIAVAIPAACFGRQRKRPGANAGTEAEVVEIVPPRESGQEASHGHSRSASWVFRRCMLSGRVGTSHVSDT